MHVFLAHYDLVNDEGVKFLVISMHHSFIDAVNRFLLERDLIRALNSPEEVRRDLSPPWVGSLVKHQQATVSLEKEKEYWMRHIKGSSTQIIYQTPSDARGTGVLRHIVKHVPLDSSHRVGMSAVIATAWCLALFRYSGVHDFCLAMANMGRQGSFPGVDRVLGSLFGISFFRFQLADPHCSTRAVLQDVNHELTAHGEHCLPINPTGGLPVIQSLMNIKWDPELSNHPRLEI